VASAQVEITSATPTAPQLAAWRKLWAILLAPAQPDPIAVGETATAPEKSGIASAGKVDGGGTRWARDSNASEGATSEAFGAEQTNKG
jgi:hypothetical protein